MRLGWIDRANRKTVYYLPKLDSTKDLFNRESVVEYSQRFFREVKGLGNVLLVYRGRVIAKRGI